MKKQGNYRRWIAQNLIEDTFYYKSVSDKETVRKCMVKLFIYHVP